MASPSSKSKNDGDKNDNGDEEYDAPLSDPGGAAQKRNPIEPDKDEE